MEIKNTLFFLVSISIIALMIMFELLTSENRDYINIAFNKRKKWFIFKNFTRFIFVFIIIISLFFSLKGKKIEFKNEKFFNKYDIENIFKNKSKEGDIKGVDKVKGLLDGIKENITEEKKEDNQKEQPKTVKSLLDGIE